DAPEGIRVPSLDSLRGRADQRATYALVDTLLVCGNDTSSQRILRLSNDGEQQLYIASFTDFGPNGGPYELTSFGAANERAYRFIGFNENCLPLGNFAAEINLAAPQQQQMMAFGGAYQRKGSRLSWEGARSILDLNRFSDIDGADNQGLALRLDAAQQLALGVQDSSWRLSLKGHFETLAATFRPFIPYRSPEFFRDWNLSNRLGSEQPLPGDETLFGFGAELRRPGWGQFGYSLGQFSRQGSYQGERHTGSLALGRNGWQLQTTAALLKSQQDQTEGSFWQPSFSIAKRFAALGNWQLRMEYVGERSEQRNTVTDTLLPFSFGFERTAVGLRSAEGKNTW
ncbi:MAG: hypothetical protein HC821_03710, partial [Lewinella sp.]|nr:hypothetical protein [Lewinella sp.]